MSNSDELAMTVVEAVAEREGVDPIELDVPLHEAIDAEALESLFATTAGPAASVTFRYYGYEIRVDGTGEVRLSDADSGGARPTVRA